jgi:hypothetical protein
VADRRIGIHEVEIAEQVNVQCGHRSHLLACMAVGQTGGGCPTGGSSPFDLIGQVDAANSICYFVGVDRHFVDQCVYQWKNLPIGKGR